MPFHYTFYAIFYAQGRKFMLILCRGAIDPILKLKQTEQENLNLTD